MARVFIPSALRVLTSGVEAVDVDGATLGELFAGLDARFPGIAQRMTAGDRVAPWLSVVVNGSLASKSLFAPVDSNSEVHFLPAISGGSENSSSTSFCKSGSRNRSV